jgi:hypothetical protein
MGSLNWNRHSHVTTRSTTTVAAISLLLATVAVISVTLTDDVFARNDRHGSYGDAAGQAAAVSNSCLNPAFDSNTIDNVIGVGNCAGTGSQQEESGQASSPITHQTANPTIEVQRTTTTQPPLTGTPPTTQRCELCFVNLTPTQRSAFEAEAETTIEQLCAFLVNLIVSGQDPTEALESIDEILDRLEETGQIDSNIHSAINACLARLG